MNVINTTLVRLEGFRSRVKINPYIFAFLILGIGIILQFIINHNTQQINYRVLVICIFLAAWYGGFFPCIIATVVGFLFADYFFIPPIHTFFPYPSEYLAATIFVAEGILFGLMGEARKIREKEINKAYKAERRARREAEEANRIQDDFISMASHELKSPITTQKLYIQTLQKHIQAKDVADSKKYINKINDQADMLIQLINDLLNVAKIKAGKLTMDFKRVNFIELVHSIIDEVQFTNPTHKISLQGFSAKSVYADKEKISGVLKNLLSNAIKYSPKAKKIIVRINERGKNLELNITDYGIGISKANQKKLFTKYFRAEGASEKNYKGFGMGLFFVSETIKLHKGKLWVKSTLGKGSTFSFSLPIYK